MLSSSLSSSSSSDEDWLEQDVLASNSVMAERELEKVCSKIYNEGYSDGRVAGDEAALAVSAEKGLRRGLLVGKICGTIYASCRLKIQQRQFADGTTKDLPEKLRQLFFERLPAALSDSPQLTRELVAEVRVLLRLVGPDIEAELLSQLQAV